MLPATTPATSVGVWLKQQTLSLESSEKDDVRSWKNREWRGDSAGWLLCDTLVTKATSTSPADETKGRSFIATQSHLKTMFLLIVLFFKNP